MQNKIKRVRQQQIRHHEAIKKQRIQQKEQFYRLTQGESGIRHSRLGVKCGYATITGGLITTLFSPWNGLGIMDHRWDYSSLKLVSHQTYRSKIKKVEWFS